MIDRARKTRFESYLICRRHRNDVVTEINTTPKTTLDFKGDFSLIVLKDTDKPKIELR